MAASDLLEQTMTTTQQTLDLLSTQSQTQACEPQSTAEQMPQQPDEKELSYRDSLPGAPKPICADTSSDGNSHQDSPSETYDASIFDELYGSAGPSSPTEPVSPPPPPPALPAKSTLRSSRMLDGLPLKMGLVGESTKVDTPQDAAPAAPQPHEVYLSSEEDASSTADDFSDYDFSEGELDDYEDAIIVEGEEASSTGSASPSTRTSEDGQPAEGAHKRQRSREDIARIVSFVFSGKPSIIDITELRIRRSATPVSLADRLSPESERSSLASTRRSPPPAPILIPSRQHQPSLSRRVSISSNMTSSTANSRVPSTASTIDEIKASRPSFLSIDPFARPASTPLVPPTSEHGGAEEDEKAGRTGVLMKTLKLVRKRSRQTLHASFAGSSEPSPTISISAEGRAAEEQQASPAAVSYGDIMRAAKKNAHFAESARPQSPAVPPSPATTTRNKLFNAIQRRRSLKIL